jgi:two-component system, NarL family, sensor histidine kinase DegS
LAPSFHFGLVRHSLDRILFLLPIIYTSFIFKQRAGLIVCGAAVVVMLPRVIFLSPAPADALLETVGVAAIGIFACLWISTRTTQSEKFHKMLSELETAHHSLQRYVVLTRDNERRLTVLNTISNVLTESLELKTILQKAIHLVMELMDVEVVLIYHLDSDAGELILVAHGGVTDAFTREVGKVKVGEGLYGKTAYLKQPLNSEGVEDVLTTMPEYKKMKIKSQLAVPLIHRERVIGVISVAMRRPRQFLSGETELLSAIAKQIATRIDNSRLYESERMTAQKLAVSERNYRELFENANDAIWVHDLSGNVLFANRASSKLNGYAFEDFIGMNVKEFLSDRSLSLAAQIRRSLLEKQPMMQPYEQRLRRKDGTEVIVMMTTSLVTENGRNIAFHHIARDVTEEKRMQENLRYYLNQITNIQEEERKRIARELHDDTSQALYALSRQIDNFLRGEHQLSPEQITFIKGLSQQVNQAQEGVRRFSQALRPPMLDDLGLVPTIRWLVNDMAKFMETRVELEVHGDERRLSNEKELTLFRAVQEALRNVWKHAKATEAQIIMQFDNDKIQIIVNDNGTGFSHQDAVDRPPRNGKFGLSGIEERMHLLGGTLKIHSELGKGTTLTLEAPVS